jgi:hypothetical protein
MSTAVLVKGEVRASNTTLEHKATDVEVNAKF